MTAGARKAGSTARELAGRSFLYGFAGIAGKAAALITVPFLARQLGPSEYGLADLATTTAALLGLAVMFAGDLSTARRAGLAQTGEERALYLRMYVVATGFVAVVAAMVLIPVSGWLADSLWSSPGQGGLAALAIVLVPVSALQAALANVPRLTGHGRQHAALALIDLLAQLSMAVLFVALGMGPAGVIVGFIVGSFIGLAAAAWPARQLLVGRVDARIGMRLVREGVPYLPALVLPMIADYVTRVVLANQLSTGDVGLFGVAIRIASLMSLMAGAFTSAYGPDLLGRRYTAATAEAFGRVFNSYVITLAATAIMLSLWAPEITAIVAGTRFAGASPILVWMAAAGAASGCYALLVVAAGAGERSGSVWWTAASGAVVQIAAVGTLTPWLGVGASGVAILAGQLTSVALLAWALSTRIPRLGLPVAVLMATAGICTLAITLHGADGSLLTRSVVGLVVGGGGSVHRRARSCQQEAGDAGIGAGTMTPSWEDQKCGS